MSQGYYTRHEGSAGALLAAAREELNLSVSEVARHLKLSPAQVEALEEGAYERLPGRVFVRGFLRNYAKLLGIDPQPLLRTMDHEMPEPAVVNEPPPSAEVVMPREQASRWPLYAGYAAILIVGALAVYEFGFNDPARGPDKSDTQDVSSSPADAAMAGGVSSTPAVGPATSPPLSKTSPVTPPSTAGASAPAPGSALPATVSSAAADAAPALPPGQRALHFRFELDSWVEVRDRDGKIILSKLNRAGTEERVSGAPPFKLVVGNARGVRLTYDERPVELAPHIGVTVARLTLQ